MTEALGVAEAALYVTDLDRATVFYVQMLGLPLTASFDDARFLQTGRCSTLILLSAEGIRRRISAIPGHGLAGAGHVALAVPADEIDARREQLERHGVAIEHEQARPCGGRSVCFWGPGNHSPELSTDDHYLQEWQRYVASADGDWR